MCLTGMPGAGKSTVAAVLKEKGFSVIIMGDIVREEAVRRNMELTDTNLGNLMIKLREQMGPGAIAHLIIKKMEECNFNHETNNLVIDGIRNISEVQILKKIGYVKIIAVHASPSRRFEYIKKRARSDKPLSTKDFFTRDKRELKVGISEPIALANESLPNNNLSIKELKKKTFQIVQKWLDKVN